MNVLRINVCGQIAELPVTAVGADLLAWATSGRFPGVRSDNLRLVFRKRFIDPAEPLAALQQKDGEWLLPVEATCRHSSPYDAELGHYLCGWC